jgi:hypothetical protein
LPVVPRVVFAGLLFLVGHKDEKNAYITLERLCSLFETMAGRNVYLSLLAENDHALQQLITLRFVHSFALHYPFPAWKIRQQISSALVHALAPAQL